MKFHLDRLLWVLFRIGLVIVLASWLKNTSAMNTSNISNWDRFIMLYLMPLGFIFGIGDILSAMDGMENSGLVAVVYMVLVLVFGWVIGLYRCMGAIIKIFVDDDN